MKHNPDIHAVSDLTSQANDPPQRDLQVGQSERGVSSGQRGAGPGESEPPADSRKRLSRVRRMARELRQRKVCRVAITYVLVMWLNLQIGDIMFPLLGFPEWTLEFVMLIGIMGFPVVLILAWTFQITATGIVVDIDSESNSAEPQLDSVVNVLLLILSVMLAGLLIMQFSSEERTDNRDLPGLTSYEILRAHPLEEATGSTKLSSQ